jgi:hypothetical protein
MVFAGILLIAFGYLACTFSIIPASAQKKIEYKVVGLSASTDNPQGFQSFLNNIAADGWEYHSLRSTSSFIFKR